MAPPGVVEIMDRFQKVKYLGKQILVDWFLNKSNVVADVFRSSGADERRGNVRIRAGELDR
jgi:hypothetical protein